ncbi:hypothetical protein ACIHJG_04860 [Streptomyces sp. NPDC052415]|uniref:hypothetical protein n=1 Tax=Streptomyces sp. NPDC052415 TaxID=3365690 RepID=UPI0037D32207
MRQAFVHEAVVGMAPDGDAGAPGAAITVALCGHWEHEPPCLLAPHHTTAERVGGEVRLRVLFAAEPAAEAEVRGRIEAGLARGCLDGPDGVTTRWRLKVAGPGVVREDEAGHAERLLRA